MQKPDMSKTYLPKRHASLSVMPIRLLSQLFHIDPTQRHTSGLPDATITPSQANGSRSAKPNRAKAKQTGLRLQAWEWQLLRDIQHYGGFLPKAQAFDLYVAHRADRRPPRNTSTFRRRLQMLRHKHLIYSAPVVSQQQGVVDVVYLGHEGAKLLAGRQRLTGQGRFIYRRNPPRYFDHDWLEAQAHMTVEQAADQVKKTKILEWIHAFKLQKSGIPVKCTHPYNRYSYTREVVADSFCQLQFRKRVFRFFWEFDNETWREPNLTTDKLVPYIEMTQSSGLEMFGGWPYRLVWVAHRAERVRQIKAKFETITARLGIPHHARFFLITTFEQLTAEDLLVKPIFDQAGRQGRVRLFES